MSEAVRSVQKVDLVIEHAGELIPCTGPATGITGNELSRLVVIEDGAIAVDEGSILAVGTSREIGAQFNGCQTIDANGCLVSPGLVDAHSHLVYAGSRHDEWEYQVTGSKRPGSLQGGIHRSVRWTHDASDSALQSQALNDLDLMLSHGTTTLEAKTGYGLARKDELRLLNLTSRLRHPIDIAPTFLGMHVPPAERLHDTDTYVDEMVEMLADIADETEYCDVCCDPIGFTPEQCHKVGRAALDLGLGVRVHADQTGDAKGALLAARLGAASADHLDYTSDEGFAALADAGTVAVFLPGVAHHMLELSPGLKEGDVVAPEKLFMPLVVRRAIDSGCVVALSADYNPGSCPCPSMQVVMQLAARLFRLSYAQIWNMCTINAAASLGRGRITGSLEPGKRADIILWTEPSHGEVINRFGYNMTDKVFASGRLVVTDGRVVN